MKAENENDNQQGYPILLFIYFFKKVRKNYIHGSNLRQGRSNKPKDSVGISL